MHLELVEDISADEFLLCLRHFMARCGIPHQIISDNVKQFKATKQILSKAGPKFQIMLIITFPNKVSIGNSLLSWLLGWEAFMSVWWG